MRTRIWISMGIVLLMLAGGLASLAPHIPVCTSEQQDRTRAEGEYTSTKMYSDTDEIKKIIVDDIDPASPGNEVIVVGNSEYVTMLAGAHQTWTAKTLYQDKWFIESVAYGDIDPRRAGKELVTCGWGDRVSMVYYEDGKWKNEVIFDHGEILYDIVICDIYPDHPGNEVVYVGEWYQVNVGFFEDGKWKNITAWKDSYYLSNIEFADLDPEVPGPELYVSGGSQRIVQVHWDNGSFRAKTLVHANTIRDLHSGDAYPGHPGDELLYCSGPKLYMLYQNETVNATSGNTTYEWVNRLIYTDSKYISAISVGDIFPGDGSPGNEILLATRSNYGLVLRYIANGDRYLDTYPYTNPTYLTACAIGDFDKSHDGVEGVVAGLQGRVVKVQYEVEDFSVVPLQEEVAITQGKKDSLYCIVDTLGGYDKPVRFSLEQTTKGALEAQGMTVTLSSSKITPLGLLFINITTTGSTPVGTYPLKLACSSEGTIDGAIREKEIVMSITVLDTSKANFKMEPLSYYQGIVGDFSFTTRIDVSLVSGSPGSKVHLDEWRVPLNANASLPTSLTLNDNHYFEVTFHSKASTVPGRYIISISGRLENGSHRLIHHMPLVVDLRATGDPDFGLNVDFPTMSVHKNTTGNQTITVQSIFGFKDPVDVTVEGMPPDVAWKLSVSNVVPTTNITLAITPSLNASETDHYITVKASRGLSVKEMVFMLQVLPPIPDFRVFFLRDLERLNVTEGPLVIYLKLGIQPIFDFSGEVNLQIEYEQGEGGNLIVELMYNQTFTLDSYREEVIRLNVTNVTKHHYLNVTANVSEVSGNIYRRNGMSLELTLPEDEENGNGWGLNWRIIVFIVLGIIILLALGGYFYMRYTGKLGQKDIKPSDEDEEEEAPKTTKGSEEEDQTPKTKKEPGTKKGRKTADKGGKNKFKKSGKRK